MPQQAFECGVSAQLRSTPHSKVIQEMMVGYQRAIKQEGQCVGDAAGEILQLFALMILLQEP